MHLGAAQFLLGGDLAGSGHQQRRAGQEGARAVAHHDHHVAQARHVGATRRARAVLHGHHRDAGRRQPRQVAKQRTAVYKAFDAVAHQVGAGALDQVDEGQLVQQRDLLHPQDLVQSHGLDRTGLDARVAGHHHAAHAADPADAGNDAATGHRQRRVLVVLRIAGQRTQRQVGRARVQQQAYALARQQLATLFEHRPRLGRRLRGALFQRPQLRQPRQHRLTAGQRHAAVSVPVGIKHRHANTAFSRIRKTPWGSRTGGSRRTA